MIKTIFNDSLYAFDLEKHFTIEQCVSIARKTRAEFKSNQGGYHSSNLKDKIIMQPLMNDILKHTALYCEELGLRSNLEIGNIWLNINEYRHSNTAHTHPQSCISGAYYVSCPDRCGQIQFVRESNKLIDSYWLPYSKTPNEYSWNKFGVTPHEGLLLLFPSFLEHSVQQNLNKVTPRISFSFNLV